MIGRLTAGQLAAGAVVTARLRGRHRLADAVDAPTVRLAAVR